MKRKSDAFIFMILATCFSSSADAKTTFLPDYMEETMEFEGCSGGGEDYCLCERSKNPVYHLALSKPQCPDPKIFDHTCPHSSDWISECYCPASYNQTCTSPYRGVGKICDGKYQECCDTRCRAGTTSPCSYPYVTDYTSSTGCGETCYVCRYGNDCNTSCSSSENATATGGTNDFNGRACVTCSPKCTPSRSETGCECGSYSCSDGCGGTRTCCNTCSDPTPPSCTATCASRGYKSYRPSGQTCSTTTVCGDTCYYNCKSSSSEPSTPSCTDTCASKGYKTSQPSGQTCSTTTVCGKTCYYNCKASTSTCTVQSCSGYSLSSCPSNGNCSSCTAVASNCSKSTKYKLDSCKSGYTKSGNSCIKAHTHNFTCPSGYSSNPCGSSQKQTGTTAKKCTCGQTSGTCYKCEMRTCTDTCAQWRNNPKCTLRGRWTDTMSTTCDGVGGGIGEGCIDYGCNSLWYCCK